MAFSICLYSLIKKNFKILRNIIFLFCLPIILIFGAYILTGFFYDYFLNYFEFSKAVDSKYSLGENILSQNGTKINIVNKRNIIDHFLYNSVFHFFYFQILLVFYLIGFSLSIKKIKGYLIFISYWYQYQYNGIDFYLSH